MKTKIFLLLLSSVFVFSSCNDFLDRASREEIEDEKYWENEDRLALYANAFYPYFFMGYGTASSSSYMILEGYTFNDDMVINGYQSDFTRNVPTSGTGSTSTTTGSELGWNSTFTGPNWNFAWIRKANVMLNRIETRMTNILTDEAYNHWTSVARFFRALEYARLVSVYGDVPYYDFELTTADVEELYKERTKRNDVMDAVYDDFVYAMQNSRLSAGSQMVNKYVIASFVARWSLVEGTWQKYHEKDNARAEKFLKLAIDAAEMVMNSGKYDIKVDFRTLFGSTTAPTEDCILYRSYDLGLSVKHNIASKCNLQESRNMGASLDLVKAFICVDGKDFETSTLANAKDFSLSELIKTRDPRFEATFWHEPNYMAKGSLLAITKFISREGLAYKENGGTPEIEYTGSNNVNGYPVMRYAEVLLNWIEAKAEYATIGGPEVVQTDIDKSINKIRKRPLDAVAKSKGVTQTADMDINNLPQDPNRDSDVSSLIWEIRRERRMELAFEHSRILDLRRWKKIEYMDTSANPDLMLGTWVNFPKEAPQMLKENGVKDKFQVTNKDGRIIIYNGSNDAEMVGFFNTQNTKGRQPYLNMEGSINPYLAPIPATLIEQYKAKGYTISQTKGWPVN